MNDDNFALKPATVAIWLVIVLVIITIFMALGWLFAGNDFFMYKFFAPRQEAVRRQVYEQSKAYHQGSVQRLDKLCDELSNADADHKPMLNDIVVHEFVEWDVADVPPYLRPCLNTARSK